MLFAALLFVPSYVSATCYWANSTLAPDSQYSIAPDDTACFPNQNNSPCCGTGWTCLSDGVCYIEQQGEGFYYRGTHFSSYQSKEMYSLEANMLYRYMYRQNLGLSAMSRMVFRRKSVDLQVCSIA